MLVSTVTASSLVRSAPIGTPALTACAAAWSIAVPPSAWTFTSCTPGSPAAASTAPATVFGMSWNFRSRKIPQPSFDTSRTASGPAAVNSCMPTLNMPTRSATCLANFIAVFRESKSSATIRLVRGWASKLKESGAREELVGVVPGVCTLCWQLHQFQPHLRYTRVDQTKLPGYAIGYINFAPFLIRTSVINTHNLKFAVPGVNHPYPRAEW